MQIYIYIFNYTAYGKSPPSDWLFSFIFNLDLRGGGGSADGTQRAGGSSSDSGNKSSVKELLFLPNV